MEYIALDYRTLTVLGGAMPNRAVWNNGTPLARRGKDTYAFG